MSVSDTRSPGRPRAFETEAVLDAAVELFWEQGYRGTTTRELERAAGLSQSSLYNAFGSKHQLLVSALDRYESQLTTQTLAPLESSDAGLGSIDRFFAVLGAWLIEHRRGCLLINMMAEDGGQSPEITERTRGYRERIGAAFDGALARAVELGEISAADAAGRGPALVSATIGLNLLGRSGAERGEIDALVAGTRALVASWRR